MSVKHGILALLTEGPAYGAQLRTTWLARTGQTWPLNVGQVYTTLGRLERDGLVAADGGPDEEGRIAYRITDAGRAEVEGWWSSPVISTEVPRDELAIKLALAVSVEGVDLTALVQRQRVASMTRLRSLTREKAQAEDAVEAAPGGGVGEMSRLLVIERLIYTTEAELTWLDQVEARARRSAGGVR